MTKPRTLISQVGWYPDNESLAERLQEGQLDIKGWGYPGSFFRGSRMTLTAESKDRFSRIGGKELKEVDPGCPGAL